MKLIAMQGQTLERIEIDRPELTTTDAIHQWYLSLMTSDGMNWQHQLDVVEHDLSPEQVDALKRMHASVASWAILFVDPNAPAPGPQVP